MNDDQRPRCCRVCLDAGEFSRIYNEISGAKVSTPIGVSRLIVRSGAILESALSRVNSSTTN